MTFVVVIVKYIDFETFKKLVERKREKNKMQKQKHYISTFEQSFDLRRFKKLKIRESLDAFEVIRIFEKYTQKQTIQYLFKKIVFIDIAQNQIVVVQNEYNKKFNARFNCVDVCFNNFEKHLKRLINLQNDDREKRAREKLFVIIVVVFSNKKTLHQNLFNLFDKFKHTLVSNLVNIALNEILFDKKRKKKLFDFESNEKKNVFANRI